MSLRKQIFFILISTALAVIIIGFVSSRQKKEFISDEIDDFQQSQLAYVHQVSEKVQMTFAKLYDDLYSLSQMVDVQFMKKNTCMLNMIRAYTMNRKLIRGIYRVDVERQVRYSYPLQDNPVAGEQLDRIFETCRLTGKSLFRVVSQRNDGTDFLVIALPVYTVQGKIHLNPSNKFSGIIFFVTTLDDIQQYFFSTATFGKGGYPWAITEDTLLVSTHNTLHRGKKFADFLPEELSGAESSGILAIIDKMKNGESGTGEYFYTLHDNAREDYTKLAAYTPLYLPDQRWAIGISNLLEEVVAPLDQALQMQTLYTACLLLLIIAMATTAVFLIRRNHTAQMNRLIAKEKENQLIRKEWQYTFDTIDSMIVLLDGKMNIIRANKATGAMCNIPMDDLPGTPLMALLFDEDEDVPGNPISPAGSTGEAHTQKIRSSKLNKVLLFTALPMHESSGNLVKVIIYAKDITEMEEIQSQLNRAQKMESIGLMAGGVAHDLNNILSGIVGYPELILLQLSKDSELRQPLMAIQESGTRASEVVSDLLTVARGIAAEKVSADLNILITEYLDSPEYRKLTTLHPNITWETGLDSELLYISCSQVHIKKCIMNLMTNAAEAVSGKGRVIISTRNQYIDEPISDNQYMEEGEYVVLCVSDTGSGIPEKDIDRIFEPFYTKKVMGTSGTGLGLTIIWNTVQDHGGGVLVTSDDRGTSFELFFPSTREELFINIDSISKKELQSHGERILVVDDEPQQLDIATRMLTSLGYHVDSVSSGEEAIEYLQKNAVDVVMLDMIMGTGMNGRQTYEQIVKIYPDQKAVITSGFSKNEEVQKAQSLGAGKFVKKPYIMKQIGQAVKQVLHGE
ncbi:MAG: response regulator [Candidatus Marinimicrobia bacterium]|nr:response regulator [Candidatus Neomarinimicrobiota bacterium]